MCGNEMKSLNPNLRILPCRRTSPTVNVVYDYAVPPSTSTSSPLRSHHSLTQYPLRCAVLGAGFAGLSVVWHLLKNVKTCLPSCRVETLNDEEAQSLVPGLCLPSNTAFYMPEALNINPQHYLQALFQACKNLVKESSTLDPGKKQLSLHKRSVHTLSEFEGEYDAVIVCLGAQVNMLPEISGRLPLRTCRGVIAHLELPDDIREGYPERGPSILSDAWIAVQSPRILNVGSTWEWKSRNSSPNVSTDEASEALLKLLPKASAIYPGIKEWVLTGARAGLRAMPPLTSLGSLPLLGCINDVIGRSHTCKYWLFGGLGSRGLLYHGWLGNLMAHAVLSCNEEVIPSELTSWKNTKLKF